MSPEPKRRRRARPADERATRTNDELRQLRATVVALRDELDRARIADDVRLRDAANAAHDESQALRQTIQALRDELDATVQRAREECDRLDADWRSQLTEAQRTIVELRAQLEGRHEASRR
jgi:small-conductance mechanosensitive channel